MRPVQLSAFGQASKHRPPARAPLRSISERNALVVQYQRLPYHIVHKLKNNPLIKRLDVDDATQIGFLRLLRAAELWDSTRQVKFISYAYHSIQRGLFEAARRLYKPNDPLTNAKYLPEKDWGRYCDLLPTVTCPDTLVPQEAYAAWQLLPRRSKYIVWRVVVEKETYTQVAEKLFITKERVRQLLRDALDWLAKVVDGQKVAPLQYRLDSKTRRKKSA